ncbi:MAG: Tetratricopeptide 4 [Planctomycetaceae bacterium]|nr:Tetratricopeptide 4 [Planctomycetaceae bacterium]
MLAPSRLSSGGRLGQRVIEPANSPGARRCCACLAGFWIVAVLSGCAWWREYRDTFAYSQGLYRRAIENESKGKPAEAVALLRQSIEANPDDPEIRWELARLLLDQGQTAEALRELRYLVKHFPDDSRAYMSLARTLLQRGRYDDAAELADLALDLDARNTEGLVLRAQIAEARGDTPLALETYHHILLQQPENAEARIRLARLEMEQGDHRCAAALLRETLANVPLTAEQAGATHWLLGMNFAREERWQEAAAALARGLPREHATAQHRYELAYACYRAGDSQRAKMELTQVLHTEPDNSPAKAMLAELDSLPETRLQFPLTVVPTNHTIH